MNWGNYTGFERRFIPPGRYRVADPPMSLTPAQARSDLALTLESIPARRAAIDELISLNGIDPPVEGRRYDHYMALIHLAHDVDDHRLGDLYACLNGDLGLIVSDDARKESGGQLRIKLGTGKGNIHYQRITIAGFTSVPNKHYEVSFEWRLFVYGISIADGDPPDENRLEHAFITTMSEV